MANVPVPASTRDDKISRVLELKQDNENQWQGRNRIRAIMDGGIEGLSEIIGRDLTEDHRDLPVANMLLKANERMGQKLGLRPDIKVDPPATHDSKRARANADKKARVVESFDQASKMRLQLPQNGLWLPGYGFTPWTISQRRTRNGDPYPHAEVRNPYNCFPGQWGGVADQPRDLAFIHKMTEDRLASLYPDLESQIRGRNKSYASTNKVNGGVLLSNLNMSSHANQFGKGLDVYEYWNQEGTWWLVPERDLVLEYIPNPIQSGPAFYVMKRFAFNKIVSAYEHAIGLMAAIARLNILSIMAAEDVVHAETNIFGEVLSGSYEKGKDAINQLEMGAKVSKMNERIPFEVFNQLDRIEGQLRNMASYPVTDDAISPNSFVTGQGLSELTSSVDLEIRQFQTIISDGAEELDAKRMEWDENMYGSMKKSIYGVRSGEPFAETYRPSSVFKGSYNTRRVYGIMAGWDEPNKIVGGLNLNQAGVIDRGTVRENIDGLENHTKVAERVLNEQVEDGLLQATIAAAQQQDPNALKALVSMLPEGDLKSLFETVYIEPMEQQQQQQQAPADPGAPPDTTTILSRLTGSGPTQGVQTVTRV